MSIPAPSNADDFEKAGFNESWEILSRGCEIPPSLEVFKHELKERRRTNTTLTPSGCARRLSDSYHRTRFTYEEY